MTNGELAVLVSSVKDTVVSIEALLREQNGRIGRAEGVVAVLKDRSDRIESTAESTARASKMWGGGTALAVAVWEIVKYFLVN